MDHPDATPSTKVRAAEALAKLRPSEEPTASADGDPRAAMAAVVEKLRPQPPELRNMPQAAALVSD